VSKTFLGSLALAMKDREIGKGKEGRVGEKRGGEERAEGEEGREGGSLFHGSWGGWTPLTTRHSMWS
jgi:hypothetical protein